MKTIGMRRSALLSLLVACSVPCGAQNCGWSQVDHEIAYDASGIWNPNAYRGLVGALTVAEIGGAIWEGSESRFGKTMWQGIDSEIISDIAATAGKYIFTRVRPSTENNPCLWFKGGSNYSFPSGEAAVSAALVTPYIIEYGGDNPADLCIAVASAIRRRWADSRTRRTGRPTWWRAGRSEVFPAGTPTAGTCRS